MLLACMIIISNKRMYFIYLLKTILCAYWHQVKFLKCVFRSTIFFCVIFPTDIKMCFHWSTELNRASELGKSTKISCSTLFFMNKNIQTWSFQVISHLNSVFLLRAVSLIWKCTIAAVYKSYLPKLLTDLPVCMFFKRIVT